MTTPAPAEKKRTRTPRKRPGKGATAADFLFFIVVGAATFLYQSLAWILILLGGFILVATVVLTVRGEPVSEGASNLASGAIGLGMAAVGVAMVLVLIRRFRFGFWDTVPFLPGPGF